MSTALVPSSSPASAPPSLETPTDRDLEIYKKVKISRIPQFEVATEYGLHYSRVSQIVKNVHLWLIAGGQLTDPDLKDHAARQRLSRAAHQLRLLRCLELATDAMEADPIPLETIKRRLIHGQEQWCEETKRDQPQRRLAAIRVVLRTTEALHKLEREREAPAEPQPAADQDLVPAIFELLCTLRIRAQAEGRIRVSAEGRLQNTANDPLENAADVTSLVATTLNNLLGTQLATSATIDSHPLPADPSIQPSAHASSSVPTPLNLSADPNNANTTTPNANAPYADSSAVFAKENLQLERPATAPFSAPSTDSSPRASPISHAPQPPPSTSYAQHPHPIHDRHAPHHGPHPPPQKYQQFPAPTPPPKNPPAPIHASPADSSPPIRLI